MSGSYHRILSAALLLLVAGCKRESLVMQTPPMPSGWAHFTTTAPNPLPVRPATFEGSLPRPLSQMSGQELYDFVKTRQRGKGMNAERKCRGFSCWLGAHTLVGIEAIVDANFLDDQNASPNGTIGAVAVNKGSHTSSRYGFEPNTGNVKHTYAFIVYPASASTGATYIVEEIRQDGTTYSHSTVLTGNFILCHHSIWWSEAQAAFQTCDGKMSRGVAGTGIVTAGFDLLALPKALLSVAERSMMLYAADDTPGWISCASGCCTFGSAEAN